MRRQEGRARLRAALLLAVGGGFVIFFGWAGFGFWPLELVALVPLFAAMELVRDRSVVVAILVAWVYGVIGIAGGYHWMLEFTEVFSGFAKPLSLLVFCMFSLALGLQYGVQGWLYAWIRNRGWGVSMAAIPPFIATEWIYPKLFPAYLGTTLLSEPLLIQIADLGGPLLVSFVVGVTNVAAFETLRWTSGVRSAPILVLCASVAVVLSTLVYGAVRIAQVESRMAESPAMTVGVVQVNMGVFEKQSQMLEAHRRYLEQSRELEAEGSVDLLIWPESAYNYPRFDRTLPLLAADVKHGLRAPLLFGGLSVTRVGGRRHLYNSVFLADAKGLVGQRYDKRKLAMFGEYLPFGEQFPRLYLLSPNTGMFVPGTHVHPLRLDPWRVSTPICYEAVLPGFIREMVSKGDPHLLVNLSNDAWFGTTQGPWIHLRLAQMRAVEHRRYLVRATNSGVSAIVDPVGRVDALTDVGVRDNLVGSVRLMTGRTVYGRLGDWPGWVSLLLVALTLVRRKPVGVSTSP